MTGDIRSSLQHLFAQGLDRWWSEDVPVLFPAFMAARLATMRLGRLVQALATAAATFPAVPVLEHLPEVYAGRVSAASFERLWVWANLQNPGLGVLSPKTIAAVYLAVLLTGLLAGPPDLGPRPTRRPPPDLARTAGDAMNWAGVLLAATLLAVLIGTLLPDRSWLAWIDPLSAPTGQPVVLAAAVSTNGALFLAVELLFSARAGMVWPRLLFWRILAGALAAAISWGLSAL